jgi:hypothetical protein
MQDFLGSLSTHHEQNIRGALQWSSEHNESIPLESIHKCSVPVPLLLSLQWE